MFRETYLWIVDGEPMLSKRIGLVKPEPRAQIRRVLPRNIYILCKPREILKAGKTSHLLAFHPLHARGQLSHCTSKVLLSQKEEEPDLMPGQQCTEKKQRRLSSPSSETDSTSSAGSYPVVGLDSQWHR